MSIATTLRQRYEAKEQDQQRKAGDRYRQLVRTVATAAGKEPSLEQIEQAATAAGKTIAAFTADVERQEKRIAIAERFQKIPAQRAKLAELNQAIGGHEATLREAHERHARAVEGLVAQADELASQVEQADALKKLLIATADAETIAAIDAAAEEHFRADTAVRQAREAIEISCGSQQLLEKHSGKPGFDREHHEKIVAAARAATEQLPALEQDLADAEARYAQARQKQLEA